MTIFLRLLLFWCNWKVMLVLIVITDTNDNFCACFLKFFVFQHFSQFSNYHKFIMMILVLSRTQWQKYHDKCTDEERLHDKKFLQLLNRKYQKYRLYSANNIKTHVQHILSTFVLCVFLLLMLIYLCLSVKRSTDVIWLS